MLVPLFLKGGLQGGALVATMNGFSIHRGLFKNVD